MVALAAVVGIGFWSGAPALAATATEMIEESSLPAWAEDLDALWLCIAAFLVFFMQAGFALVETGFTRAKNACNILMKNIADFSIGTLSFWAVGFGIMFGMSGNGLFGQSRFFYEATKGADWAFLLFQTVFCATAATIMSGAMAERTKYSAYLLCSLVITALVYPVFGCWAWNGLFGGGGGWLEGGRVLNALFGDGAAFHDFAGSTVVHSIGGWAALAGTIALGPRLGKFGKRGRCNEIPGHNIPLAALGVFILWFGWFGFNPGSTGTLTGADFAKIAVNTNLAAAAGALGALFTSWYAFGRTDPTYTLNGSLAGLVAITAGCDVMAPAMAVMTGLIAGPIVIASIRLIERLGIDDPVGAVSVHGVCGAWGTLAVGLFAVDMGLVMGGGVRQLLVQLLGVVVAFVWAFPVSYALFRLIRSTSGLRVSRRQEMDSLDLSEHGVRAYQQAGGGLRSEH